MTHSIADGCTVPKPYISLNSLERGKFSHIPSPRRDYGSKPTCLSRSRDWCDVRVGTCFTAALVMVVLVYGWVAGDRARQMAEVRSLCRDRDSLCQDLGDIEERIALIGGQLMSAGAANASHQLQAVGDMVARLFNCTRV